ncbi:WXG100 family type VII secretion target [Streptomyces collinus]|uniref:WXG100 family type VII secretion target n=1 Tax=Streptomyces collinus TaxID=42684 RepID=UPI0037B42A63
MSDEQHKQDLERASNQNNFADVARNVEHSKGNGFLPGFMSDPLRAMVGSTAPGKAVFGSTDFGAKDLDLNAMIDLIGQTAPEDLESSGKALWDARDAIQSAADELRGRIERVKWKGQAGTDFQKYGRSLVQSTDGLSEFAGNAGDQISAAAVGLASVRTAMPKRDPRNLKRPESYSEAEKTEKKDEYEAAVKVEKDRQEAINQMNRLASYYAVSSQQLSVLQEHPPTFRSLPTMGMPPQTVDGGSGTAGEGAGTAAKTAATTYHAPTEAQGRSSVDGVTDTRAAESIPKGRASYPDDAVGTTIDSVDTLPPTTTTPATGNVPPVTGTPPAMGGQPGTSDSYAPTVPGRANGRTTGGASAARTPVTARGRTQPGSINPANGRTGPGATNQTGRPTATGQPIAKGTGSGSRPFSMGQSGVQGGTPRSGGTAAPRTNTGPATGAGRANGVVGGRPTATGGAAAKGGQQIPRGTVVGAGPHAGARPSTGAPGQRGVFGAPQTGMRPGAGGASRGGATAGNRPVTGNPAGRNSGVQAERNGMTHGGAGLLRRPGKGRPGDERDAQGAQRPDYVVEDEATHLPNTPRRDVPPVVN